MLSGRTYRSADMATMKKRPVPLHFCSRLKKNCKLVLSLPCSQQALFNVGYNPTMSTKPKFAQAKIKKMLQSDEDMGKVASGAPIVISRALEMFIASLTKQSCEVAEKAGSRTLSAGHLYVPPLPCTPSICVAMEKFFTSYTFVCVCDGTPPPFSWLNARLRCCTGSYCGWLWYTHVSTSRDRKVCIEENPQFDYLKTFVADVPLPSVSVSMGGEGSAVAHLPSMRSVLWLCWWAQISQVWLICT